MAAGALPQLGTAQKFDSSATANTLVLRDNSGGVSNGPEATTQLTLTGSLTLPFVVKTGNYTIVWGAGGDHTIYADTSGGSITLTLPSPATVAAGGRLKVLRKSASNTLTLARAAAESINGSAANKTVTATAFLMVWIETDGTDWIVNTGNVI